MARWNARMLPLAVGLAIMTGPPVDAAGERVDVAVAPRQSGLPRSVAQLPSILYASYDMTGSGRAHGRPFKPSADGQGPDGLLMEPYPNGAEAVLGIPLARQYAEFQGVLEFDPSAPAMAPLKAAIYLDGRVVLETPDLRGPDGSFELRVDTQGKCFLEIRVGNAKADSGGGRAILRSSAVYPLSPEAVYYATPALAVREAVAEISLNRTLPGGPCDYLVRSGPSPDTLSEGWSPWAPLSLPYAPAAPYLQLKVVPKPQGAQGMPGHVLVNVHPAAADAAPEAPPESPSSPNIVLIGVDTLRADHLSCYGYRKPTSPTIDALAAQGTVFLDNVTAIATTRPSFSSIMTGVHPWDIAFVGRGREDIVYNGCAMADTEVTLAEVLHARGYRTGAFIAAAPLKGRKMKFANGFDVFDDQFAVTRRPGDAVADKALAFIEESEGLDAPFFAFVHFFDPHWTYGGTPATYDAMRDAADHEFVNMYDGAIRFVDSQVARILDVLRTSGAYDNTLIVFTADHGETLDEHLLMWTHSDVYETCLRVPLIFKLPAAGPGPVRAAATPTRLIDIVPTVLDLIGAPLPDYGRRRHGVSLKPFLFPEPGAAPPALEETFCFKHIPEGKHRELDKQEARFYAVRRGGFKYIATSLDAPPELYDIGFSTGEQESAKPGRDETADALGERIRWFFFSKERSEVTPFDDGEGPGIEQSLRDQLEALGYF
ncbi:MAG: sulfatase-like hydrolase/transferase [Candidatus Hydrogenedentes bacterium]|nr:sulfatase-like hydrolase/transferase [Candidatus Hydrogenedentota bacterium]